MKSQPQHARKPKHAKPKQKFMQRPGQQTRLITAVVCLMAAIIFVSPDYPGSRPMLAFHTTGAILLCGSAFAIGWIAGSIAHKRKRNK